MESQKTHILLERLFHIKTETSLSFYTLYAILIIPYLSKILSSYKAVSWSFLLYGKSFYSVSIQQWQVWSYSLYGLWFNLVRYVENI